MTPKQFLATLDGEAKAHLAGIHDSIIKHDRKVVPTVERMMGKEMLVYKCEGVFKYAVAGMKNYMTFHVMPMYAFPPLYKKYVAKLPKAKFQKGCINFKTAAEMPLAVVDELMQDCAAQDYSLILEMIKRRKR